MKTRTPCRPLPGWAWFIWLGCAGMGCLGLLAACLHGLIRLLP